MFLKRGHSISVCVARNYSAKGGLCLNTSQCISVTDPDIRAPERGWEKTEDE